MTVHYKEIEPARRLQISSVIPAFFRDNDDIARLESLGEGNINDTYLIRFSQRAPVVLQRINDRVFPVPETVADNVALVTAHLASHRSEKTGEWSGYRFPESLSAIDGKSHFRDNNGAVWRMLSYVEKSIGHQVVTHPAQANDVGRILGCFHQFLSDMDLSLLSDPLPGFHDLARYRQAYKEAVIAHGRSSSEALDYCVEMVESRIDVPTLAERCAQQGIANRVIHGDPKCDNFLFRADSKRGMSMIDLDTVSAGPLVQDLGDCLRSVCNPAGEKSRLGVCFDVDFCRRLLGGYREYGVLSEAEANLIFHSARLLTYELGVRFLTDYLENDRYFKVVDKRENLLRAVVQFTLLESIEEQREVIEAIVADLS